MMKYPGEICKRIIRVSGRGNRPKSLFIGGHGYVSIPSRQGISTDVPVSKSWVHKKALPSLSPFIDRRVGVWFNEVTELLSIYGGKFVRRL